MVTVPVTQESELKITCNDDYYLTISITYSELPCNACTHVPVYTIHLNTYIIGTLFITNIEASIQSGLIIIRSPPSFC